MNKKGLVTVKSLKIVWGISLMLLMGCREVHYYEFRPIKLDVLSGRIEISLAGQFGENFEEDGKKRLNWGAPYFLQFTYVVPKDDGLDSLVIRDIQLVGEESGTSHILPDIQSNNARTYDRGKLIRVSAGPLSSDEFSYQNYILSAVIVADANGEEVEEMISTRLETNFRTERRSDRFDQETGI